MASSASLHASFPKGASKSCVPLAPPLPGDEELAELYHWVDTIPLSRPKRNISRDFSDGAAQLQGNGKGYLTFPQAGDAANTHTYATTHCVTAHRNNPVQIEELLIEKEETIRELQETNVIMKEKIRHLEQLIKLKDERIDMLAQELSQMESLP
ncbi:SPEF1 family protein [Toxoplasma gondii]|uniref:SPEF1 family protein n=1 Tax=Toxoplasma gondii TaxID=5811 RepID=A0A7J6K4W0_TOXGO|nr:SPEF1 family protein [Toxoplasma gondii]